MDYQDDTKETLSIKNMVCRRCVETVQRVVCDLELPVQSVEMGMARFQAPLTKKEREALGLRLEAHGFSILTSRPAELVERIKQLIQERVRHPEEGGHEQKLSSDLAEKLRYDYSHLSKLFSTTEGITIERYFTLQRLERTKELLAYNESSITQIAEELGYSNAAHLASSFKKETGMRPRDFRKTKQKRGGIP